MKDTTTAELPLTYEPSGDTPKPKAVSSDTSTDQPAKPSAESTSDHENGQDTQRPRRTAKSGKGRQGQRPSRNGGGNGQNRDSQNPSGKSENSHRRERRKRKRKERKKEVPLGPPVKGEGLLEISQKGFGFLRQASTGFQQAPDDIFVTPELVRSFGLRDGMWVKGVAREGNRGPQLSEMLEICGKKPKDCADLPYFEELTAINPNKRVILENGRENYTTRVVDLVTPVGFGQRGLIVAPPRTGKTTLMQRIAEAVHHNHDYVKIFVVLIDERPEEVTELKRSLPFAEVMASSNDQDVKSHTRIAQLAIERAKRLVEAGEHVFILMDSITRLARAFNNAMNVGKGKGISRGGLAIGALEIPRRLFAAARNTREAGSLTIIGTALVQTNSAMDEAIFQEFKGTGNMELVLDRRIAEQYIWPAVNIHASGTRREELLVPNHQLEKSYVIRRGLAGHKPTEAIERLLHLMEKFPNNAQMLMEIKSAAT